VFPLPGLAQGYLRIFEIGRVYLLIGLIQLSPSMVVTELFVAEIQQGLNSD
jgi:hypothetical protein